MKLIIPFVTLAICLNISCDAQVNTSNATFKKPQQTNNKMTTTTNPYFNKTSKEKINISEQEWEKNLSPELFEIAIKKGTERAYTGKYDNFFDSGFYFCAACGNKLFESDSKFASGCGWPSFFETYAENSVQYITDKSHGMIRTEVVCGRCNAHLGHVFDDGPKPTGKRFCMNSISLVFEKK
jgi:peptide-methionine (R)-S-oxide reductase